MRKTKISIIMVMSIAMAGCSGFFLGKDNTPKPMAVQHSSSTTMVKKVWSTKISGASENNGLRFTIGHDSNTLYVTSAKGVINALDISTGKQRWTKKVGALYSGVGSNGQQVFVGTKSGKLVALTASNGQELWSQKLSGAPLTTPVSNLSTVIVRTLSGAVEAFDAATGNASWAYIVAVPDINIRGGAMPVIVDNRVLVPTDMGQLGVLDIEDGRVIWGQNFGKSRGGNAMGRVSDIDAEPIVDNGVIYLGISRVGLTAVPLSGSKPLWSTQQSVYSGMVVDADTLYVVHENGEVRGHNKRNGEVNWTLSSLLNRKLTRPALLNNRIVVGDFEGYVHVIDTNSGALLGSVKIAKKPFLPDILYLNGGVVLQDNSGGVYRITI